MLEINGQTFDWVFCGAQTQYSWLIALAHTNSPVNTQADLFSARVKYKLSTTIFKFRLRSTKTDAL